MIYVISDLHGYPLKKFHKLLKTARFSDADTLYILGDVIDKNNDGGVEMLLWLLGQSNIHLILGNHEEMLLDCEDAFDEMAETIWESSCMKSRAIQRYTQSGGGVTLSALYELKKETPHTFQQLFSYLHQAPLFKRTSVAGREYLLVHSGIDNFEKEKSLAEYNRSDFLWAWPELEDQYYDDVITIFGHTPTVSYGEQYRGKLIKTRTWIDIDVGAAYDMEPILFRLDDWKEFSLAIHE